MRATTASSDIASAASTPKKRRLVVARRLRVAPLRRARVVVRVLEGRQAARIHQLVREALGLAPPRARRRRRVGVHLINVINVVHIINIVHVVQ